MAKRTLIVTGQKPISPIKTKSGGEATLYEVYATTEEGELVEESLRSFAELEEGIAIEYTVDPYNHPQYGTSFTLTPPRRNTQKRLRAVEEQLELMLAWAKSQGYNPENFQRPSADEEEPPSVRKHEKPPEPTPAPDDPELDQEFGETMPE